MKFCIFSRTPYSDSVIHVATIQLKCKAKFSSDQYHTEPLYTGLAVKRSSPVIMSLFLFERLLMGAFQFRSKCWAKRTCLSK